MVKKKKLTFDERLSAILWHRLGHPTTWIAQSLGRHRASLYRFLRRYQEMLERLPELGDKDSHVVARILHDESLRRHSEASHKRTRLKRKEIQVYVEWGLKHAWGVMTIAGRMEKELGLCISAEAIYQWINDCRPELKEYLPVAGKVRRRRRTGRKARKRPTSVPKKSIELRPHTANQRQRIGDFELDAILSCRGAKSALQVLVDRRCRKVFLEKVSCLEAKLYTETLCARIHSDIPVIHSVTSDNGSEHADFASVESALSIEWFFCHPYCASERGTVENRNRFIRKFFPKGTNFDDIPDEYIQWVEEFINNYPLEVLGFSTPNEIWAENLIKEAA